MKGLPLLILSLSHECEEVVSHINSPLSSSDSFIHLFLQLPCLSKAPTPIAVPLPQSSTPSYLQHHKPFARLLQQNFLAENLIICCWSGGFQLVASLNRLYRRSHETVSQMMHYRSFKRWHSVGAMHPSLKHTTFLLIPPNSGGPAPFRRSHNLE